MENQNTRLLTGVGGALQVDRGVCILRTGAVTGEIKGLTGRVAGDGMVCFFELHGVVLGKLCRHAQQIGD